MDRPRLWLAALVLAFTVLRWRRRGHVELSFDPCDGEGRPREFAGMHRAPFANPGAYVMCSCGHMLQTLDEYRKHWESGHLDRPLYWERA